MGINTRMKGREPISSSVRLVISESTAKMIKLNMPRSKGSEAALITAQLADISASGCSVEAPYLIPSGADLEVKIDAAPFVMETGGKHEGPIDASCKVAHCVMREAGLYRLGLSFTRISPEAVALIEDFVRARERRNKPRSEMS